MAYDTIASYGAQWKVTGLNRRPAHQQWVDGNFFLQNHGKSWRCGLSIRSNPNREPYHYMLTGNMKDFNFIRDRMLLEFRDGMTIHIRQMSDRDLKDLRTKMDLVKIEGGGKSSGATTRTPQRSPLNSQTTNATSTNHSQTSPPANFTSVKKNTISRKERMEAEARESGHMLENEENVGQRNTPKNKFLASSQRKCEEAVSGVTTGNFYSNNSTRSYGSMATLSKPRRSPGLMPLYPERQRNKLGEIHNKSPTYTWVNRTPQSPSAGYGNSLQGFSNLGNTCYMNAILQSLFGLDSFSSDLMYSMQYYAKQLQPDQRKSQLSWILSRLLFLTRRETGSSSEQKKQILAQVKKTISSSAKRFSGYEQHDAHEFLGQVLDQLKEEIMKLGKKTGAKKTPEEAEKQEATTLKPGESSPDGSTPDEHPNPTRDSFEFKVSHQIICKECGEKVETIETFHDLSIDMPPRKVLDSVRSIQDALDHFFLQEQLEYTCEHCGGKKATVQHKFARLPRVLVLHLKRYAYNSVTSSNTKLGQNIRIPKYLTLRRQCEEETQPPPPSQQPFNFSQEDKNVCVVSPYSSGSTNKSFSSPSVLAPTPESDSCSRKSPESQRANVSSRRRLDLGEDGELDGEPIKKMSEEESLNMVLELSKESAEKEKNSRKRLDSLTVQSMTEEEMMKVALERSIHETTRTSSPENMKDAARDVRDREEEDMDTAEENCKDFSQTGSCLVNGDGGSNSCDRETNNVLSSSSSCWEPPFKRARFDGQADSAYSSFTDDSIEDPNNRKQEAAQHTEQPDIIDMMDRTAHTEQNGNSETKPVVLELSDEENKENYTPNQNGSATKHNTSLEVDVKPKLSKEEELDEEAQIRQAIENSLRDQQQHLDETQDEEMEKAKQLSLQDNNRPILVSPRPPSWNLVRSKDEEQILAQHAEEGDLPYSYQLMSIVSHLGSSSSLGHYISDVYDTRKRTWLSWDDSHVSKVPEDDVRKNRERTGYIFFYVSKELVQELEEHYYQQRRRSRTMSLTATNSLQHKKVVVIPGSATKSPAVNVFNSVPVAR